MDSAIWLQFHIVGLWMNVDVLSPLISFCVWTFFDFYTSFHSTAWGGDETSLVYMPPWTVGIHKENMFSKGSIIITMSFNSNQRNVFPTAILVLRDTITVYALFCVCVFGCRVFRWKTDSGKCTVIPLASMGKTCALPMKHSRRSDFDIADMYA